MDYEKQIDVIRETAQAVNPHVVTVLTGKNGSGKSLLRKLVSGYLSIKLGTNPEKTVASISMESRTQQKHEFSALKSMGIDNPENPTSGETLNNFNMILSCISKDHPRYIVIDEPEIGMGEEMVCAVADMFNEKFKVLPEGCLGVMIITHNRHLVKTINGEFLNMEGMDRESWLNRKIIPVDLTTFEDESLNLWRAINKRIEENKQKKQ